jgi:hypothetical protein
MAIIFHFACSVNCLTPLKGVVKFNSFPNDSIYPLLSLKGVNPVVALLLLLSVNSVTGKLVAQLQWLLSTSVLKIWPIDQLAHSVAPSVCGWKAIEINSLVPSSHWSSFQNIDVNLLSLSEMIEAGTP